MEKLARSLAGHDKGRVFAVVRETGSVVCLADGQGRTLEHPKEKNVRHVQFIVRMPDEVKKLLEKAVQDTDIVHLLREYERQTGRSDKLQER